MKKSLYYGVMLLIKFLANAGVDARRKCEAIIKAGRVTVNGTLVTDPAFELPLRASVHCDGRKIELSEHEYYLVNKPHGVISTARDTHGREKVTDLAPKRGRLYPVGRLDADSTGLIIVTNDGDLANLLTHPRYEVPKTYRVTMVGFLPQASVKRLRYGIELDDGKTARARVKVISSTGRESKADITIHEGRNRQVRRMFAALGHPVTALQRVQFGPLKLGELGLGQYRELTPKEVLTLKKLAKTASRAAPRPKASAPPKPASPRRRR